MGLGSATSPWGRGSDRHHLWGGRHPPPKKKKNWIPQIPRHGMLLQWRPIMGSTLTYYYSPPTTILPAPLPPPVRGEVGFQSNPIGTPWWVSC